MTYGRGKGLLDYYDLATGEYQAARQRKPQRAQWMDGLQDALSVAGFFPVVGSVADIANSGISALRGNWGEAALNAIAAIPGLGDVAAIPKGMGAAGRIARRFPFLYK